MAKTAKHIHRCADCLRITIFTLNAFIWVGALVAIICGLMVGFSNGTFSLDAEESDEYDGGEIRWKDILYTTPATLLVYYGIFMLTVAIPGCFSGAGGMPFCTIIFVVMIIWILIFDILFGYIFYWNPNAMMNFIEDLNKSMDNYGVGNKKKVGIIRFSATEYWDHLQRTGSCCGLFDAYEWLNKTIGSEERDFSLPDSCCTKDYDYYQCGWRIWKHMEGDMGHYRYQMLKNVGCIGIFPEEVTTKYHEISYIVITLGVIMVLCAICAIVLLALMCTKKYRAPHGPQEMPHFLRRRPLTNNKVAPEPMTQERKDGGTKVVEQQQRTEHLRSILKKTEGSAENIYVNKEFKGHTASDYETLPVVYKEEAETRMRRKEFTRPQSK